MSRKLARETALQALFQLDITKSEINEALSYAVEMNKLNSKDREYVKQTVEGVTQKIEVLDKIIKETSHSWEFNRIALVDKNILRMGLYELFYVDDIPPNVIINEAVELGKKFSTEDSGRFINGILGKVMEDHDKFKNLVNESVV